MTVTTLELTARDPVVSRDGRPFGAGQGNRMRSVNWPLPSVIAGSLRTALGKSAGRDFSLETAKELLHVAFGGVLPLVDGQLCLPAPQDCVVHPSRGSLRAVPQLFNNSGGDWPTGLRPVMLLEEIEDFKPQDAPAWWPIERFIEWSLGKDVKFDQTFLNSPQQDVRTHVVMESETGSAEEGQLFSTAALALSHLGRYGNGGDPAQRDRWADVMLAVRAEADGWCGESLKKLDGHFPTGGERRLVHWRANTKSSIWECPDAIRLALSTDGNVRMTLATPAIFASGWKPGWLDHDLTGSPPGCGVRIKLVALSIQRWRGVRMVAGSHQ